MLLDSKKTHQKIKRIAYEIYENHFKEKDIYIAGLNGQGYLFAEYLCAEIENISSIKAHKIKVEVDKDDPMKKEVKIDIPLSTLKNKCIILADDVLNTGRTITAGFKPFLTVDLKKLETAFVVVRGHKSFPVSADYIGYSLLTTIQDHIEVVLHPKDQSGVYLR